MRTAALVTLLLGCDVQGAAPQAPPRASRSSVRPRTATIPTVAPRRAEVIDPWNAPPADDPPVEAAEVEDREVQRYERMARIRDELDKDKDGKVTPAELEADPHHRPRFGEPGAIDLDTDGDLSVDELLTSRAAKRAARWY